MDKLHNSMTLKKKRIIVCFSIIFLAVVSIFIYAFFTYPRIEFKLTSSNIREPLLVYYTDSNMEYFDDEHMISDIIVEEKQRYSFVVPDIESLRIDIGISSGMTKISDIKVKTFLTTKEVTPQYVSKCAFSIDVGEVLVEKNAVLIESIGTDPYVILGTLDDVESIFNWHRVIVILLVLIVLIVGLGFFIKYFEKIKKIENGIINLEERTKWWIIIAMLIIAAVIRYFYKLDAWPCFHDDEYQTFGVAYGYIKTGTFYQWDFPRNCISDQSYRRAWPYTILLANWIRIFGLSEVSCRAMSALLGIIFIISCIYITKKLFRSRKITAVTVIIILFNSAITQLFRFTRMYALLMPLSLWMVYFAFKALTETNGIDDNATNRILRFIKKNFDFHIGYTLITLVFVYFSYKTHVNSLVLCLGILPFVFYKTFSTKDRKYIILSVAAFGVMLLLTLGIFFYEQIKTIPILGGILSVLKSSGGWFTCIYKEYLWAILNEFGSVLLAVLFILVYILVIVKMLYERNEHKADKLIYLIGIVLVTVIFFVFFTSRGYYSIKYIIMLTPISAMVYAIGFWGICQWKKICGILICAVFCICGSISVYKGYDSIYIGARYSNFIPAYQTIAKYYNLDEDIVPIAGAYVRGYYFAQVVKNYASVGLNTDNSLETLIEFAEEYPEGIISCEKGKTWHLTGGINEFMMKWSDRLAGEGLDDYRVEVAHYHFINGNKVNLRREGIDKYVLCLGENEDALDIIVDLEAFENDDQVLCVKIEYKNTAKEEEKRFFQLKLPKDKKGVYKYALPSNFINDWNGEDIEISDKYAVYASGILTEFGR